MIKIKHNMKNCHFIESELQYLNCTHNTPRLGAHSTSSGIIHFTFYTVTLGGALLLYLNKKISFFFFVQ